MTSPQQPEQPPVAGYDPDQLDAAAAPAEAATAAALVAVAAAAAAGLIAAGSRIPGGATHAAYVTLDDLASITSMWAQKTDTQLMPMLEKIFGTAAEHVHRQISDYFGGLPPELTQQLPATVPSISDVTAQDVLNAARNRLVGIGDLLWANARDQMSEGLRQGESIPQLADRVRSAAGVTEPRARNIARTEVISASNAAAHLQAQSAGVDMEKEWIDTHDNRTRLTHRIAGGQRVPLTQPFTVGGFPLMFPGDPAGPPGEVINCRCGLGFHFAGGPLVAAATRKLEGEALDEFNRKHPRGFGGKGDITEDPEWRALVGLDSPAQKKPVTAGAEHHLSGSELAHFNEEHLRDRKGRFADHIGDALKTGLKESLDKFTRTQLRDYATKKRGLVLPRGASEDVIKQRLLEEAGHKLEGAVGAPVPAALDRLALSKKTIAELREYGKAQGVKLPAKARKADLVELLVPAGGGVEAAQARQADIGHIRGRAEVLAEAEELFANGEDSEKIARRLDSLARQQNAADDPELAKVLASVAAGHDSSHAIDSAAAKLGLTRTVAAGDVVPFNAREQEHLERAPTAGTPVHVVRPGYRYSRDGEDVQVVKARVEEATPAEVAKFRDKRLADLAAAVPEKPVKKAASRAAKVDAGVLAEQFAQAVQRPMPSDRERFRKELAGLTIKQLTALNGGPFPKGTKQENINHLIEHKIGFKLDSDTIRLRTNEGDLRYAVTAEHKAQIQKRIDLSKALREADTQGDRTEYDRLRKQLIALHGYTGTLPKPEAKTASPSASAKSAGSYTGPSFAMSAQDSRQAERWNQLQEQLDQTDRYDYEKSGRISDEIDALEQLMRPPLRRRLRQQAEVDREIEYLRSNLELEGEPYSPQEIRDKLTAQIGQEFAGKKIAVRVTPSALSKILADRRFKNQIETGSGGAVAAYVPQKRKELEAQLYGIPESGFPAEKRPISGYVALHGIGPADDDIWLSQHGRVQVVLKDSVRDRTTAMVGDVLDQRSLAIPTPVNSPDAVSYNTRWIGAGSNPIGRDLKTLKAVYAEANIHNGLPTSDIEEVVFPDQPSSALIAELGREGIPWRIIPSQPKG